MYTIHHGDMLDVLAALEPDSVDSIVCDPPYGLSFMGRGWDHGVPGPDYWRAALRVLKPGGHMLAFGGSRTYHRLTCAVEDAGFEIRDCVMWLYGSGFPKSHDVSKAIDREAGAEREVVGKSPHAANRTAPEGYDGWTGSDDRLVTAPATEAAKQWAGWGTALKPAYEPVILVRKPLEGTVAQNVLKHGVGGLNIDGCRIPAEAGRPLVTSDRRDGNVVYGDGLQGSRAVPGGTDLGRWPANIMHDGSDEVLTGFPEAGGGFGVRGEHNDTQATKWGFTQRGQTVGYGDSGTAARFFYCAKASKKDRGEANNHPTVKPTELLRYLCRLITPPGGLVLDPFAGSGSTGKAALLEGFRFIGVEREEEYVRIAAARLAAVEAT